MFHTLEIKHIYFPLSKSYEKQLFHIQMPDFIM